MTKHDNFENHDQGLDGSGVTQMLDQKDQSTILTIFYIGP